MEHVEEHCAQETSWQFIRSGGIFTRKQEWNKMAKFDQDWWTPNQKDGALIITSKGCVYLRNQEMQTYLGFYIDF